MDNHDLIALVPRLVRNDASKSLDVKLKRRCQRSKLVDYSKSVQAA